MKGTIIERNGSYRLRVALGKNYAGKYENYFETFHGSKPEAQKRLRELLTQHDKGIFVKPGKMTVAEYLQSWLDDFCQPSLAPRTVELYRYITKVHLNPTIGNIRLMDLTSQRIQKLYSDKLREGLKPRTVEIIHVVVHIKPQPR